MRGRVRKREMIDIERETEIERERERENDVSDGVSCLGYKIQQREHG